MRLVVWDASAWLPEDPADAARSECVKPEIGLNHWCWPHTFTQALFTELIRNILQHPVNMVMLQPRRRKH